MKLLFVLLIVFSTNAVILCQKKYDVKAYINKQSGDAYFRASKTAQEIPITGKKKVGTKLYSDEEIRCGKSCSIELLMCTNSKVIVTETNVWHRIPNIVCNEEFIPGYKKTYRPGGRIANNNFIVNEDDLWRLPLRNRSTLLGVAIGGIVGSNRTLLGSSRMLEYELGELFELVPPSSIFSQKYSYSWRFQYPYEGALAIPKFFSLEVAKSNYQSDEVKLHLIITLSAYENNNSLSVSREWKKELYLQNDLFVNTKGESFNPQEMQSFLNEARKYYGKLPVRIFCTITVAEVNVDTNLDTNPRTFGFEFNVMTDEDEKIILNQLEISTKETGFAHYIGRAEIFERLGLLRLAINEYSEGLKEFPENELFENKLSILKKASSFSAK